jgi:hypothetical protein
MGSRNRFTKRPKKKEEEKKYTTRAGRGSNRVAVKAKAAVKKLADIPASKRPKDMQAGKVYGDAGQPAAPKLPPKPTAKKPAPTKKPTPKTTAKPAAKKAPAYNTPSTTKGPTKSGNLYQSKGATTKGGPTADGKTYKNQIKSKRLRDALSNLKVRKYKK